MKAFMIGFLFLLAAFSASFGQQIYNSCVENEGADISVSLPTSFTTANTKLPDPFKKIDGTKISAKDDWKTRRQELLKLAERTVYGTKPAKSDNVSGTVARDKITVKVGNSSFSVSVSMPSTGSAPYPVVIRYGDSGADAATMKALGVAVINYTPTDVGKETGGARTKSGVFYTVNSGSPYNKTGTLAAWAWGVSRIIDVIEADPNKLFDPMRVGVTGCSRYGKGPFAAGALDQRIALTMPMEGGTGGAAIMRGAAKESGAQSPSNAYGEQPWLGDDFQPFSTNPNNLPIDMHAVVGLIAPRGLLILEKPSAADWLASRSGHMSALAGSEVYKALGYGGNITYHSNNNNGNHCAWISEWKPLVEDNIKRFLLRTQAPPAAPVINPRSDRTFATADWIDWTAPTLSGSLAIKGCGTSPNTSSSSVQGGTSSSSSSRATTVSSSSVATAVSSSSVATAVSSSSVATAVSSSSVATAVSSSSRATTASSSSRANASSSSVATTPSSSSSEEPSPIISNISLTHLTLSGVVEIFDIKGNKVASVNISNSQKVKLSLPSGLYFAKARGMQSVKFVVK